jgi:predicted neutral ceramidase superfamily lipid hydrolase
MCLSLCEVVVAAVEEEEADLAQFMVEAHIEEVGEDTMVAEEHLSEEAEDVAEVREAVPVAVVAAMEPIKILITKHILYHSSSCEDVRC